MKGVKTMQVTVNGAAISEQEQQAYVDYVQAKAPDRKIDYIKVQVDGEYADLEYRFAEVPFERIRRITGYLVGTMDRWNNAKRAEEHDRVKHGCSCGM